MTGERGVYGLIAISLAMMFIVIIMAARGIYFHFKLPATFWSISLFFLTFAIGILAPVAGVGGYVLFVPVVSAFYPFSITFVRGVGLVMARVNALVSVPRFLRVGLASLRLDYWQLLLLDLQSQEQNGYLDCKSISKRKVLHICRSRCITILHICHNDSIKESRVSRS